MQLATRVLAAPIALLIGTALASPALLAQTPVQPASQTAHDPFAPVYIVSSASTYRQRIRPLASSARSVDGTTGNALVISQVQAHEVAGISHRIHVEEKRCGGFFAFASLVEAEQFVQAGRSAQAIATSFADYSIDNQTTVEPWLPQVSEANIRATIDHLSNDYNNRYYASSHGYDAAVWIRDHWLSLAGGRNDVSAELFDCGNCGGQPSVILTIAGSDPDLRDEIVVLGGHLDSVSRSGSGDNMDAPGADDDASGIATLTEVIRIVLADGWQPRRTVKFMGYAAEEVGLRGSNAIASSFAGQGRDVVGVLQLDMTNYAAGASVDMRLLTDYSNADLQQFSRDVFDEYLAPLGLTRGTYTCDYGCSDHASWTSAGYPAVMMFEATFNDDIHTPYDTLANMGNTAQASVPLAQFGLAFLGELAKTAGGDSPPGNEPPTAAFSATIDGLSATFTDNSSDPDGSIASQNWDFGDGNSSTAANPTHTYAADGTYSVTLTVTDNSGATDTATQQVTVGGGGGGGNVLSDEVPVDNLSASRGEDLRYTMEVPAGASSVSFTISGGSGDADLYVQYGSAPTDGSYDCRPYRYGNAETCTFDNPQAGTWHVRLDAYESFSGVTLVGDFQVSGGGGNDPQTYENSGNYAINDNATVASPISVSGRSGNAPGDTQVYIDVRHSYVGDLKIDLVAPDGSTYNLWNRSGGSGNNVIGTATLNLSSESLNGTWKLRVNDNYTYDSGYINEWRVTF